tara:strand:- start:1177 stop:1371 length:195 start_codon:yes stop_codon:yes gene_type:complete
MKYWETEYNGEHVRISWNGASTFNFQTPIGGQWVDYHCFTCYGIDSEQEAMKYALEALQEHDDE